MTECERLQQKAREWLSPRTPENVIWEIEWIVKKAWMAGRESYKNELQEAIAFHAEKEAEAHGNGAVFELDPERAAARFPMLEGVED